MSTGGAEFSRQPVEGTLEIINTFHDNVKNDRKIESE